MTIRTGIWAACAAAFLAGAASADEARYHYDGDMHLSPESGTMALDWTLSVRDDALTEVTFMLNPAFADVEITGDDVLSTQREMVDTFGGSISRFTITLVPSADGADRDIRIRYAGRLFEESPPTPINTLDPDKIELTVDSFWLPFDAGFDALITADLDIWLPGTWTGVTQHVITPTAGGFHVDQDEPALDLPITLMSRYQSFSAPGYSIYDTRDPAGTNTDALAEALEHCTTYLNGLAGRAGPLPDARIIVTSRTSGGYSRGTLIALTDIAETEPAPLMQFICHELGHYWSRGNAMTVENWLNESFADYVAIMGMRAALGEDAYENRLARYRRQLAEADQVLPPIWTPETTDRPPYLVAYRKGPLALARAEALVGRQVFADFLRQTMEQGVSTTPQMLDVFERVAGAEARAGFEAILAE